MCKYILGWTVDTAWGNIQLPDKWLSKFSDLLDTPSLQRHLSVDKFRRLIRKLISMNMSVPGAIGPFYHLQLVLMHVGTGCIAYLSKVFR